MMLPKNITRNLLNGLLILITIIQPVATTLLPSETLAAEAANVPQFPQADAVQAAISAAAATVDITAEGFDPAEVTIQPGETVVWVNRTTEPQRIIGDASSYRIYLPLVMRNAIGGTIILPPQNRGLNSSQDTSWDSGDIAAGMTYTYTFNTVGEYTYYLHESPEITGQVIVRQQLQPDFAMAISPSIRHILPGDTLTYTVALTATNGFTAPVTLSVSNLPTGITETWKTNPVTPTTSTLLTLTTTGDTPAGEHRFTVAGAGGGQSHEVPATLHVAGDCVPITTAQFTSNSPVELGHPLHFTATTGPANAIQPLTYTWDFGAGPLMGNATPTHTFNAPGTYTVTLNVKNPCGTVTFTDKVAVTELPPMPNLVVDAISTDPGVPVAGQPCEVQVRLANIGDRNVTERFTVAAYIEPAGDTITWTQNSLGTRGIQSLNTVYTFTTAGVQMLYAQVDSTHLITESDENDNITGPLTLTISATPQPDLTITDLNIIPLTPTLGQPATLTVEIENRGTLSDTDDVRVDGYVTTTSPRAGQAGDVFTTTTALGAGQSAVVRMPYTFTTAGAQTVYAQADALNAIAESIEDNNVSSPLTFNVRTPKPDLVVESITFSPRVGWVDEMVTATVRVRNQGDAAASAFRADWYLNPTEPPFAEQTGDGYWEVPELDVGATTELTFTYDFETIGTHWVYAQVDTQGAITESVEANNVEGESLPVVNQSEDVCGDITEDATWYAGTVYYVTCDVNVNMGVTLTVEPDTVMSFNNGLAINVDGILLAQGTATQTIVFTANAENPMPGQWEGIYVSGSGNATLDYTIIRYGGFYGTSSWDALIYVTDGGKLELTNSTLAFSDWYGVLINGAETPNIVENLFHDCGREAIRIIDDADGNAAAPVIRNNVIDNSVLGAIVIGGQYLTGERTITGNSGSGNGTNSIYVSAAFTGNTTLSADNELSWHFAGDADIPTGQTLVIDPGAVVKYTGGELDVSGTLIANGTDGNEVVFTSLSDDAYGGDTNADGEATVPAAGQWEGIYVSGSGNATLDHTIIRYGGHYGSLSWDTLIYVKDGGKLELTNSTLAFSEWYGVLIEGAETPNIVDNHFHDCGREAIRIIDDADGNAAAPVIRNNVIDNSVLGAIVIGGQYLTGERTITGNSGSGNGTNSIYVSAAFTGNTTLSADNELSWHFAGDADIPTGQTLVIDPGAVVKYAGGELDVSGTLIANGTDGNEVVFTSLSDDAYGGDTNADGEATVPAAGQWEGIYVSGSGNATLDHTIIRYGGHYGSLSWDTLIYVKDGGKLELTNSTLAFSEWYGVLIEGAETPNIVDNHFHDCGREAIRIIDDADGNAAAPVIRNNVIDNSVLGAIVIGGQYLTGERTITGNSGSGNGTNSIYVSAAFTGNTTLSADNELSWHFAGDADIPTGQTLVIDPGAVVKYAGGELDVSGTLIANGTDGNEVVFTSLSDDAYGGDTNADGEATVPAAGQWEGIYVSGSGNATLDHTIIRYGGHYGSLSWDTLIYVKDGGKLELTNSTLAFSEWYGVLIEGAETPNIVDNHFHDCGREAIRIIDDADGNAAAPVIRNNVIDNSVLGAIVIGGQYLTGERTITGNSGSGNGTNSIYVSAAFTGNTTLSADNELSWHVAGDADIPTGQTLVIDPGAVVKYAGGELDVSGTLIANGTDGNEVVFTSLSDDAYGGDTNADGEATVPAAGQWEGIYVSGSGNATLDHTIIRYGGHYGSLSWDTLIYVKDGGKLELTNSTLAFSEWYGVLIEGAETPNIVDNHFHDCGREAIRIIDDADGNAAAPVIRNNVIDNSVLGAIVIGGQYLTGERTITGNSGSGNGTNSIYVSAAFTGNTTLSADNELSWHVAGDADIPTGQTLVIDPGAVVKYTGGELDVSGTLIANGTDGNEVVFTSLSDDAYGGDTNADGEATVPAAGQWEGIYVSGSGNATLDHTIICYGGHYGSLSWDTLIYVKDGGKLELTNSTLAFSEWYGVLIESENHTIRHNSIYNNGSYGIYNGNTDNIIVHAEHNWWGDVSGPAPYGSGDGINYRTCYDSDTGSYYICEYYVDADPWIGKQTQESEDIVNDALPNDPLRNTAAMEPGVPYIKSVDSAYGHVFLGNVDLDNPYKVAVDWNGSETGGGSPGNVIFIVNNRRVQEVGETWGAGHTFNIGAEFAGGFNEIEIVAYNAAGTASRPMNVGVAKIVLPGWLEELGVSDERGNINLTFNQDYMEFLMKYSLPPSPFEAKVDIPLWFPFFGGEKAGIEAQADGALRLRSDATGRINLGGEAGFEAVKQKINGSIAGQGDAHLAPAGYIVFDEAQMDFTIGGKFQAKMPLLEFIPQVAALSNTPVVGGLIAKVTNKMQVYAIIKPDAVYHASWGPTADQTHWEWKGGTGEAGLSDEVGLKLDIIDDVEASVSGNGKGRMYFTTPQGGNPYVHEAYLDIWGQAEFSAWGFGPYKKETDHLTWHWEQAGNRSPSIWHSSTSFSDTEDMLTLENVWLARAYDYGQQPYAVFVGNTAVGRSPTGPLATTAVMTQPLMLNIYPHPHPVIAVSPDTANTALLLWLYDDVNQPDARSKEILASRWNGVTWSSPVSVTDNTVLDYNPRIAFDGSGHAIALWERVNDPALPVSATLDVTLTNKFDLAYSIYDVAGDSWSAPQSLTADNAFDHRPHLAAGNDGQVMAVWTSNAGGQLLADSANPDTLYSAIWDGSAWSAPVMITDALTGTLRSTLAYSDSTHAVLVVNRDVDGDWTTPDDVELFSTTWDGSTWSDFTQLTDDAVRDERPMAFYTSEGEKRLVWLKDNQLVLLHDDWSATPAATDIAGDVPGLKDFDVAMDADDNLALIWQGPSAELADMFYALYDEATQTWNLESQLTHDQAIENEMAPAFTAEGELMVAHARQTMKYDDKVISPTLTITNALQPDQTDLYVLHYTPDTDLTLTDLALPEYFANPWPGDSVDVDMTIQNAGDWAVVSPTVALYDGDPALGGSLVATQTVTAGPLAGGASEDVTIRWSVPVTPVQSHTLYAVIDPDGVITESVETNNTLTLTTTTPDVAVASVKTYYYDQHNVVPLAVIANNGPVTATNVLVEFRQDAVTGTVQHTDTITELAPHGLQAITTTWDVSGWTEGEHTYYAVVDSGDAIYEVNEDDNAEVFPVKVLPDLVIYSGDVQADLTASGGPVTVTVRNWGTADATNVPVTLYEGPVITTNATALYTWTVASLLVDSDGDVQLNTTLDHRPNRLFAIADPGRVITEVAEHNNVALAKFPISHTFRYHDLEGVVPATGTVTLQGDWTSDPITLTSAADVYSVTLSTAETPLTYRYAVDGNLTLLNTVTRTVTPTLATVYDDYRLVEPDDAQLIGPATLSTTVGAPTAPITAQVTLANVTPLTGTTFAAEIGYGTSITLTEWTWTPITYLDDVGDADQFVGTLTPTASGVYSYTVRFDGNWGVGNPNAQWTYADLDGASNGFDLSNVGVLTVP